MRCCSPNRALLAELVAPSWTDAVAAKLGSWTFYSVMRQAWERDAGMQIDHLFTSPGLYITDAGVDRAMVSTTGASDHAPTWVEVCRLVRYF